MTPTTNTPFEKFAFYSVIGYIIACPCFVVLMIAAVVLMQLYGFKESEAVVEMIFLLGVVVSAVFFPLYCIACAVKIERSHFKALTQAEAELSDMVISDMKTLPPNWNPSGTIFVSENVVISSDYFKNFLWSFRKIFGGESRGFTNLLERGRREATVRLMRKARECGANAVWNVRYETSIVQKGWQNDNNGKNKLAGGEVLAYGTAFLIKDE
ncbi:MAG: heavy metal-binding domain-containing protein [Planctomycetaceae bacterium]|jgi:uncharacterized protein YbjQ (UPF0145 family)|nr:heavy metal-binding domain-containing protein [Planctomycetaceae bacterium]